MYEVGRCRLREILKSKRMTQVKLAELTGISKQQINNYINRQHIVGVMGLGTLRTIAEALNLDSPYELYEMKRVARSPEEAASD
ncbi:helix-turn-helix domain-containing protein [Paenibacillus xylanexedens]|uniref:helix-turn-helix domain-containing protein n=1 Tax=Paenibacillus xylanilyticus TaxID=248903 RepID=UPI0012B6C76B|nr:helix-turn-helix transcriptional regulator [Paenibacillus xylanexedens]